MSERRMPASAGEWVAEGVARYAEGSKMLDDALACAQGGLPFSGRVVQAQALMAAAQAAFLAAEAMQYQRPVYPVVR